MMRLSVTAWKDGLGLELGGPPSPTIIRKPRIVQENARKTTM